MSTYKSLDLADFEKHLHKVMEIACKYQDNVIKAPVVPSTDYTALYALLEEELPVAATDINELLDDFADKIVPNCTKIGHPRFLAWLLTSPSPAGTLGEMLSIAVNQIPAMYKSSPAATVIEDIVIKWFGKMFGYQEAAGGVLVSGGSAATLIGLTVAREVHFPGAMKKGIFSVEKPPVMYVSDQAHFSVERAAGVLGLGSDLVRKVPAGSDYKMCIDALKTQIIKDRAEGFAPFCVVAQVGSSHTGAVDPIQQLVTVCKDNGLWLHVDAAYGGGAIVTTEGRALLAGIEQADSIATDPHKWFFIPAEAGCVLVKNKQHLFNTFKGTNGKLEDEPATDFMNFGIQFTRAAKAFKIWFAFKAYGLTGIAQIIEQNIAMARKFAATITTAPGWQVLAPVELSAVCFRYVPDSDMGSDALNRVQQNILKYVDESGEAFFTIANLKGTLALRVCFANHRTTLSDMNLVINLLNKAAASARK